ncbi:uncharacterized protein NPIL_560841 [Nephila pilipes]|uniref:RNA-directed DNA polymerase n=1 Tax=Nephila pilipes TaxID=299642 RepID=A0A8X6NYQ6_NEPPI|nr:uncharacterized protein NPIL_560841 [Nephila pilipes]
MIALRGEIAALSEQVERLSRDQLRNRSRRRCGKSPYRSKTLSRRKDYHFNDDFCYYHNRFGSKALYFCPDSGKLITAMDVNISAADVSIAPQSGRLHIFEHATLLAHPKPDAELILHVDASDFAIGGALFQIIDNEPQPLAFFSRKLSQTEKNYSAYDRELLASYASIKHFIHMLEARDFKLFTDHKPLTDAFEQRLDKCSPRQARQLDPIPIYDISQFTTNICYLPGNENITVDSLSRIASFEMPNPINYDEIAKSQESDLELQNVISNPQGLQLQKIVMPNSDIPLFCDLSTGTVRPYIPKEYRQRIFSQFHNISHPSIQATTKLIRTRFVWPSIEGEKNLRREFP